MREYIPKTTFEKLNQTSVNYHMKINDKFTVLDAKTGERTTSVGDNGELLRANRNKLRELLSEGINVHPGKVFSHYEEKSTGEVIAYFEDGSTATGSVIVGADGAHSRVRAQLLGSKELLQPSEQVAVAAEVTVPMEFYRPIHDIGSAAIWGHTNGFRPLIGLVGTSPDCSMAHCFWVICRRSETPAEDYARIKASSKEERYDLALNQSKDFHPLFHDIVRRSDASCIHEPALQLAEFFMPETKGVKQSSKVVVLGDAAHTMIPFNLSGANTAVRDACDLARLLAEKDLSMALEAYEEISIPRGREMVLRSRANGADRDLRLINERV